MSRCCGKRVLTEILIQFLAPTLVAHPFQGITCQWSDRSSKFLNPRISHPRHEGNPQSSRVTLTNDNKRRHARTSPTPKPKPYISSYMYLCMYVCIHFGSTHAGNHTFPPPPPLKKKKRSICGPELRVVALLMLLLHTRCGSGCRLERQSKHSGSDLDLFLLHWQGSHRPPVDKVLQFLHEYKRENRVGSWGLLSATLSSDHSFVFLCFF